MKKVTKILLPVDFSEPSANAFRYAVQLADHIEASIEILNIVFPEGQGMDFPLVVEKATQTRLETAREQLKKFVDKGLNALGQVLKNSPMISSSIEIGTPIQAICTVAADNDMSLIIMGSRGENRSGIEKIIGSVAEGVVGKAQCPVMIIPDDAPFHPIRSITYATDIRDSDPFEIWKTQEFLKTFKPDVNIVHLNFKKEGNSKAWEKMEEMKAFFSDRKTSTKLEIYNIPGEDLQKDINDFIEKNKTDLLVMYQAKHSFWERIFFKSNTKYMTLHTKVPLLILKTK